MLNRNKNVDFDKSTYYDILCSEYPSFLDKYLCLPLMNRLKGIGLLCGTDWTPLYKNRFYYSRFDHSVAVALITWNFTKDKKQTLSALFHDVSTPVFSHVSDFRKGDALTQTTTEEKTSQILNSDDLLKSLLKEDNLCVKDIEDYHKYPIADNEIPCLSADRLEYMFPSGASLDASWSMKQIKKCYNDITVLKNENGIEELGFMHKNIALLYCRHFCLIGHILQLNENKLALNLLGKIMNMAEERGVLCEKDCMTLSEAQVIEKLDNIKESENLKELYALYKTFRTMKSIKHTNTPLENHYCVSLKVKQRYINPLVRCSDGSAKRISEMSKKAKRIIDDFLCFSDTLYGCVKVED